MKFHLFEAANPKKLTSIFCAFLLAVNMNVSAEPVVFAEFAAAEIESESQLYRIGLKAYSNLQEIRLKNSDISLSASDEKFEAEVFLHSETGFTLNASFKHYIKIETLFASFSDAKTSANYFEGLGFKAVVAYAGKGSFFVYLGGYDSANIAENAARNVFRANSIQSPQSNAIELRVDGKAVLCFDSLQLPLQIKSSDEKNVLGLANSSFRNILEVSRLSGQNLNPVNVLDFEEYLYGVIPAEMPSSWDLEALKAQAVAARTYGHNNLSSHKKEAYNLCDTVHCQVYKGFSSETENTNQAVDETKAVKIYHDDVLIDAVFFASSGGMTENSENVWQNPLPYLKSVKEVNETTANVWSRTFSMAEITKLLLANGVDIGSAVSVQILSHTQSGRVSELRINGTNGSKSLFKEQIRTFFASSSGGILRSRVFSFSNNLSLSKQNVVFAKGSDGPLTALSGDVSYINSLLTLGKIDAFSAFAIGANGLGKLGSFSNNSLASSSVSGTFTLYGRGNGHAVGMSQEGARGMAKLGFNYKEILKHYYTGVEVY